MSEDGPRYVRYGGRVTAVDFIVWPLLGLVSLVAMVRPLPQEVRVGALVVGGPVTLGLLLTASIGFADQRAWVEGSRIQLPLILGALVVGQMMFFASLYDLVSQSFPGSFNESLTPASAIYFSVSAWTTAGFGDIHPVSSAMRLTVSAELLIAVATVVAVLATAVAKAFAEKR